MKKYLIVTTSGEYTIECDRLLIDPSSGVLNCFDKNNLVLAAFNGFLMWRKVSE